MQTLPKMKLSLIFQIILTLFIIIILAGFYYTYIVKKNNTNLETLKDGNSKNIDKIIEDEISNELTNIEYNSYDNLGNSYYINAERAVVNIKNQEQGIVDLENVTSVISLKNKGIINIYSKYAIYEKKNHDTLFYGNVKIEYLDNIIKSDNADISFSQNISKIYNNVVYMSDNSNLSTDVILINMKTGDLKIKMIDRSKKVKIKTKYDFN